MNMDILVSELRNIRARRAELETQEEEIKDLIKEALRVSNQDTLLGPDYRITYKEVTRECLDTKSLTATFPDIVRQFMKTQRFRRFDLR